MKDFVTHVFAIFYKDMVRVSALAKIDNSKQNQQYKSLHDSYTKARTRQYQQIRKNIRTRCK